MYVCMSALTVTVVGTALYVPHIDHSTPGLQITETNLSRLAPRLFIRCLYGVHTYLVRPMYVCNIASLRHACSMVVVDWR